jgi:DNA-binding HxlR family transcriptional regulator
MLRSYDQDHCPVALTLGLIGDRWTILILRDLLLEGPRRFQDLQDSLRGAAPNTLSARLKTIEAYGLITRRPYSDHPPRLEYRLTAKGRSLVGACAEGAPRLGTPPRNQKRGSLETVGAADSGESAVLKPSVEQVRSEADR